MFIAPPVRFSALPEAERNKSIQSGHPIILNCELSDPSALVHWYKDGSKLLSQTGVDILTDGLARKMTIHSAEFFHSGQYCCKTKGDSITFNVDIKGDQFCFEQCDTLTGYSFAKQLTRIRLLPFVLLPFLLHTHSFGVIFFLDCTAACLQFTVSRLSSNLKDWHVVELRLTLNLNVSVAPPVTFSAIPEAMRTKSVEAGSPIVLQCVVSEPEAHVCWYKEEMQLISNSGLRIHSEGSTRTLVIQLAEESHGGVYRCTTQDDTVEFQVEIKGDFYISTECVDTVTPAPLLISH